MKRRPKRDYHRRSAMWVLIACALLGLLGSWRTEDNTVLAGMMIFGIVIAGVLYRKKQF